MKRSQPFWVWSVAESQPNTLCSSRDRSAAAAITVHPLGFPCGSADEESACNVGDMGLIPGLERTPGEGKGYPLHYSGLENSMDWVVHGVTQSRTRLSDFHFHLPRYTGGKKEQACHSSGIFSCLWVSGSNNFKAKRRGPLPFLLGPSFRLNPPYLLSEAWNVFIMQTTVKPKLNKKRKKRL